ncbi:hypothetical protein GCM10010304_65010 [Streptomyces roseoviolaceus]
MIFSSSLSMVPVAGCIGCRGRVFRFLRELGAGYGTVEAATERLRRLPLGEDRGRGAGDLRPRHRTRVSDSKGIQPTSKTFGSRRR